MSESKQQRLLSSSCLLVAGDNQIDTVLEQLILAGVGRIVLAGNKEQPTREPACNDDVTVETILFHNNHGDLAESLVAKVDLVIEGSLDWQLKLRLSDLCMRLNVPLIHSGCSGMRFQLFSMIPGRSACLRCVLPLIGIDDFPLIPTVRNSFAPVCTCVGALMALEAVKMLAGLGVTQGNELWKIDGLSGEIEIVRGLDPRRDCPDCGRAAMT